MQRWVSGRQVFNQQSAINDLQSPLPLNPTYFWHTNLGHSISPVSMQAVVGQANAFQKPWIIT
jgi:hypothetical protein